jgi:prophage maintenance system killer protein
MMITGGVTLKRYLTVHDLVWIVSIVTGEELDYDYAALESCVAAQYRYGGGGTPIEIAADLLQSIVHNHPFPYGNLRCAFLAFLVYLHLNGYVTRGGDIDAYTLYRNYLKGDISAEDVVQRIIHPNPISNMASIPLREIVSHLCNQYGCVLERLITDDGPQREGHDQSRG